MDYYEHSKFRAICPSCGIDLVFCAIVVDDVVINTWACDCENQQPKVRDAITEAREISDDGAAVIAF